MNTAKALDHLARVRGIERDLWSSALQPQLHQLDERLRRHGDREVVSSMATDLFAAGGKRLRALASLVVSDALGLPSAKAVRLAEIVELTHAATLLHDDVIDEADTRRGRPAARVRWNNTLAILGGDYVLVRALRLVASFDRPALIDAHLRTLDDLVSAEVAQHVARDSFDLSLPGYLRIADGKTGALFAFAAAAPCHLCRDPGGARALDQFGREVGIAFQIADDLRDVLGTDSSKPTGLDLSDGVLSLPLRLAAAADAQLAASMRQGEVSAAEIAAMLACVRESSAIEDSATIARSHLERGRSELATVEIQTRVEPLWALCDWLDHELDSSGKSRR
jgi:geranylgeranyl pyrophosphate synthase